MGDRNLSGDPKRRADRDASTEEIMRDNGNEDGGQDERRDDREPGNEEEPMSWSRAADPGPIDNTTRTAGGARRLAASQWRGRNDSPIQSSSSVVLRGRGARMDGRQRPGGGPTPRRRTRTRRRRGRGDRRLRWWLLLGRSGEHTS